MDDHGGSDLHAECQLWSAYLIDRAPPPEVVAAYQRMHARAEKGNDVTIDRILYRFARRGRWQVRLADTYARLFRPRGLLRRKIALTVALLENSHETHRALNAGPVAGQRPSGQGVGTGLLRLIPAAGAIAWWTALSVALLGPVHALVSLVGFRRG